MRPDSDAIQAALTWKLPEVGIPADEFPWFQLLIPRFYKE